MATLGDGIAAFHADREAHGLAEDVLVLTWSEFGRRVKENGNGGTDHGSASVMFALGDGVSRGIYGDPPSLTDLIDGGNLAHTTDFRRVYATVLERWFGAPSAELLGAAWELLGFLPALWAWLGARPSSRRTRHCCSLTVAAQGRGLGLARSGGPRPFRARSSP